MNPSDLLQISDDLANISARRPRRTYLCRAVSSSYYALFHCLAKTCADLFAGAGSRSNRHAWQQAYRAINHGTVKKRCSQRDPMRTFPIAVQDFGTLFIEMQRKRHNADYDPYTRFTKSAVVTDIGRVRDVIARFNAVPASDRRAFAIHVLLDQRTS